MKSSSLFSDKRGFTLIELLVVLAIIILVISLTVPSATRILQTMKLSQTGETLIGQLSFAQQRAISKNKSVQVRFYHLPKREDSAEGYRALWVLEATENANEWIPISKSLHFNSGVFIHPDKLRSSILEMPLQIDTEGPFPEPVSKASYVSFCFLPGGGTDLETSDDWFLTLYAPKNPEKESPDDLKNYFTIGIQPRTGSLRVYRP